MTSQPARDGETRDGPGSVSPHAEANPTVVASERDGETLSDEQIAFARANPGSCCTPKIVLQFCDTVAALRAELADARAVILEVGSNGLAEWITERGVYRVSLPDATWRLISEQVRATRAASGEDASHARARAAAGGETKEASHGRA